MAGFGGKSTAVLIVPTKESMIGNGAPQLVSTPPLAGIEHSGNPAEKGKLEANRTRGTDKRGKGKERRGFRAGSFQTGHFKLPSSLDVSYIKPGVYVGSKSTQVLHVAAESRRAYGRVRI